jgi:hypothetical protein
MMALERAAWSRRSVSRLAGVSPGARDQRSSVRSAQGSVRSWPSKPHSSQRRST